MSEWTHRQRVFKTAWFAKAARKERISESELRVAVREILRGQADDLGGGVYKKRLHRNMHRAIVVAKGRRFWIFAYLFAKKDRANIDDAELAAFKKLAALYDLKTDNDVEREVAIGELVEIHNDH